MAFTYIHFNDQTQHGRLLRRALQQFEEAIEGLRDVESVMIQMIDGDGSQAAHYTENATRFGFTDAAKAKEARDEISSAYAKISGNGSVSNVNAALVQLFDKLRG